MIMVVYSDTLHNMNMWC